MIFWWGTKMMPCFSTQLALIAAWTKTLWEKLQNKVDALDIDACWTTCSWHIRWNSDLSLNATWRRIGRDHSTWCGLCLEHRSGKVSRGDSWKKRNAGADSVMERLESRPILEGLKFSIPGGFRYIYYIYIYMCHILPYNSVSYYSNKEGSDPHPSITCCKQDRRRLSGRGDATKMCSSGWLPEFRRSISISMNAQLSWESSRQDVPCESSIFIHKFHRGKHILNRLKMAETPKIAETSRTNLIRHDPSVCSSVSVQLCGAREFGLCPCRDCLSV